MKQQWIDWNKHRDDWLNLNTGLSVLIYAAVAFSCTRFLAVGIERAEIETTIRPILSSFVTFLPGLLIVLAFAAYRGFYKGANESQKQGNRIVSWRRYALPITILMSISTIFLAGFLFEDLTYSQNIFERGFSFGVFPFPVYFGKDVEISIPSTIFWAGYFGYLMNLTGVTLRRITTNNLVPHFYIASSFGLIKSLIAAVLVFITLDATPGLITGDGIPDSKNGIDPRLAILIAFTAGAVADDTITWVINKIRRLLGRAVADPLPLSLVQGIDPTLESFLHDEGIDSIQALATIDVRELSTKVGVNIKIVSDWQAQASFLRNFTSAELAERFHRLGINELKDMKGLDEELLAKALAAVDPKKDLAKEDVNKVLVKVLKAELK